MHRFLELGLDILGGHCSDDRSNLPTIWIFHDFFTVLTALCPRHGHMTSSFIPQALLMLIVVYNILSLKMCRSSRVITAEDRKAYQFEYKMFLLLKFSGLGSFFLAIFPSGLPSLPSLGTFFFTIILSSSSSWPAKMPSS